MYRIIERSSGREQYVFSGKRHKKNLYKTDKRNLGLLTVFVACTVFSNMIDLLSEFSELYIVTFAPISISFLFFSHERHYYIIISYYDYCKYAL